MCKLQTPPDSPTIPTSPFPQLTVMHCCSTFGMLCNYEQATGGM